ncbi:MAG: VPLPA-CTERM sorting domain-containing protein [Aliishimia sp.]
MTNLKAMICAAVLSCMPAFATAGTIDLAGLGYELDTSYTETVTGINVIVDATGLAAFDGTGSAAVSSFDENDASAYSFILSSGLLGTDLSKTGGTVLAAMDGSIQVLFESISVAASGSIYDGAAVLVTLINSEIGYDETTGLLENTTGFAQGSARFDALSLIAPVPLPASLPLLFVAAGGLVMVRRRKTQ